MKNKTLKSIVAIMISSIIICGCGNRNTTFSDETNTSSEETNLTTEASDDIGNSADTQASEEIQENTDPDETVDELNYDISLVFAGDVNLSEDYGTTDLLDSENGDIKKCIDETLLEQMTGADLMILNNEFAYSDRGTPLENKAYTFRANPDRVSVLNNMGVDAVYLANNHVYDYGKEACLDTFDTLDNAGVKYFGAGRNIEEATTPLYYEIQGKKIALVAASRAEKNKMTPQATEDEPGILRCYDTELFCETIEEAAKNADFTIAVVHWGTEYSTDLEQVQLDTAREYVKAGADIIIGAHSHCLQGIEYVYGVPVVYGLGNFWFNEKTLDTMLAKVRLYGNESSNNVELTLIPGVQENWHTRSVTDEAEARRIYDDLEAISIDVKIDDKGEVYPDGPVPLIKNLCEVRFEVDYPVGQITKDVSVSQSFVSKTSSIVALDLLGATYKRDNTATVDVTLLVDEEQLATWSVDSSQMEDNTVMEFVLGDESTLADSKLDTDEKMVFFADKLNDSLNSDLKGKNCRIVISSEDGEPDLSPTFWMTEENNYPDGCLNVAGYDQYNDLWFQIYGME